MQTIRKKTKNEKFNNKNDAASPPNSARFRSIHIFFFFFALLTFMDVTKPVIITLHKQKILFTHTRHQKVSTHITVFVSRFLWDVSESILLRRLVKTSQIVIKILFYLSQLASHQLKYIACSVFKLNDFNVHINNINSSINGRNGCAHAFISLN